MYSHVQLNSYIWEAETTEYLLTDTLEWYKSVNNVLLLDLKINWLIVLALLIGPYLLCVCRLRAHPGSI